MPSHPSIPPFLSGYPVIAALPVLHDVGRIVVLVHRQEHPVHEYVTAVWSSNCGDSWDSGTYIETLSDALASLIERAGVRHLSDLDTFRGAV